jgi:uncharacterized coiled-coil protein SlyX
MYEYQSGVIPSLPSDYVVPDNPTDVQLLEQVIHNQEKTIEFMYYQLNENDKNIKDLHDDNTSIVNKLNDIVLQGQSGDSATTDSSTQMLQKLDNVNEQLSNIQVGSNTLVTYGVFYIPLIIICFLLWRFLLTFLKNPEHLKGGEK